MELSLDTILNTYLIPWGTKIVMAILVFVIGKWLARLLTRTLEKVMMKSKVDQMLVSFLGNIAYAALLAVVVLAALEQLDVQSPRPPGNVRPRDPVSLSSTRRSCWSCVVKHFAFLD